MNKFIATFISSEGEFLEATIEVAGQRLRVMDEFDGATLAPGQTLELELQPFISVQGEWEEIFSSNPDREKRLVSLQGWSYLALGQVVGVNPVVCDCGLITVVEPFFTTDQRCVGEYVGFKIGRLDAGRP